MSAAENPQVQLLFAKSAEDESVLLFDVPDAIFEFHLQQAIEKLLKALISAHGCRFPFTHNLQELEDQLHSLGERLPSFSVPLDYFTRFGVTARYDAGFPLTSEERQDFAEVVRSLRQFVRIRVDELPLTSTLPLP